MKKNTNPDLLIANKNSSVHRDEFNPNVNELLYLKKEILYLKRREKELEKKLVLLSETTLLEYLKKWVPGDELISSSEWALLSDQMDKYCDNFSKRLAEIYPFLTKHDVLICNLTRLGLSIETIASLTNCKYQSVLTKRSRIKQKMPQKELSLEEILSHLI